MSWMFKKRDAASYLLNYKVYLLVFLFTIFFFLILFKSFYDAHQTIKENAESNRILLAKDIQNTISSWVEEKVSYIESIAHYLGDGKTIKDEKDVVNFLKITEKSSYFDTIQVLVPERFFFIDGIKYDDFIEGFTASNPPHDKNWYKSKMWFQKTTDSMQTTCTFMPTHGFLQETTINICTPFENINLPNGMICGILKTKSMFERIERLQFLHKAY